MPELPDITVYVERIAVKAQGEAGLAALDPGGIEPLACDLATPTALAVAHAVGAADDLLPAQRRALLVDFDRVLGLGLDQPPEADVDAPLPPGAQDLLDRRAAAREARDFATADRLRDELAAMGVEVRDTPEGQLARRGK